MASTISAPLEGSPTWIDGIRAELLLHAKKLVPRGGTCGSPASPLPSH
jgi:hypothetical protein